MRSTSRADHHEWSTCRTAVVSLSDLGHSMTHLSLCQVRAFAVSGALCTEGIPEQDGGHCCDGIGLLPCA